MVSPDLGPLSWKSTAFSGVSLSSFFLPVQEGSNGTEIQTMEEKALTLCESGRWIDALKKRGRVLKKRGRVLKKRGRFLRRGV